MNKLKRNFTEGYIYSNRSNVIINICFMILGVLAGGALFLYSGDGGLPYEKLKEMLFEIKNSSSENIFTNALLNNALICGVFYILSLFYIGTFLSPVYVFIRCVAYGFTSCLVINAYEWTGVLIVLLGLVPQTILYLCGLIIFSVETSKQCRYISGCFDKALRKRSVITYFTTSLIPVLILFSGCLVESFVSPHFILWCLKKV